MHTSRQQTLICSREKSGAINCPGQCACIEIIAGDPEPHRYICQARSTGASDFNVRRLSWSTRVDFCARNLPLTTLAAFFECAFPNQVSVPGARVYATVSNDLDDVTLAEVAKMAGLLTSGQE